MHRRGPFNEYDWLLRRLVSRQLVSCWVHGVYLAV